MKKFFLSICFSLAFISQGFAETKEFSSIEEAETNVNARNREVLQKARQLEEQPTNDEEMVEFLRKRLEFLDITTLPEGERLDKVSSFSKVDESDGQEKKSFWEKIYDNAMARISGNSGVNTEDLQPVVYYAPEVSEQKAEDDIPQINIRLPDGMELKAVAYEHIPLFSTQIEILPNRMFKVYENIVVIANGQKVKEGLMRFFEKESVSRHGKIRLILEEVLVNGSALPYELVEQNNLYVIRPVRPFKLSEGVYVFEFRYLVDRALWNYGDFYEFYWDVTGSHFNLFTNRAIAAIKLPGKEPAVKKFALTGRNGHLNDENSIFMNGQDNTIGFMNLEPLRGGESLHIFMTLPKVDFFPESRTEKLIQLFEDDGDIVLCAIYLLVVAVSSVLSWLYICNRLKFRYMTVSSPILMRSLWRGGADKKSLGGALLDLFRKNIIDIEQHNDDVILVRKSAHRKHYSGFDNKMLNIMFSKKDSVCKLSRGEKADKLMQLVSQETEKQVKLLGLRMSGIYILFNVLMLAVLEIALCLWNPQSLLPGILLLADFALVITIIAAFLFRGHWGQKAVMGLIMLFGAIISLILLGIYLNKTAVVLMSAGILTAVIFNQKVGGREAILKNAVKSVYQQREFLRLQKENIASGRHFAAQQASVYVLDLEKEYPENPKIKNNYRLKAIEELLINIF